MLSRTILTVLLALAVTAVSARAQADMVPWPPACPPGSQGASSHDGSWCAPAPCRSNGDCEGKDLECRSWRVCTQTFSVEPRGRGAYGNPPRDREEVLATCAPDGKCDGVNEPPPETAGTARSTPPVCKVADYCVPKPLPGLLDNRSSGTGRCKCSMVGEHRGQGGWALALLLFGLGIARARRGQ